jgi:hypothetical protein
MDTKCLDTWLSTLCPGGRRVWPEGGLEGSGTSEKGLHVSFAHRGAFDTHAVAPHTKRFRTQLAPMGGSLYDERLYQSID